MSIILALDISSSSTGVCVFSDGQILYNEAIKLRQKSHAEKLVIFDATIRAIANKYKPDVIAIEDCFQGRNRKTFKTLALYHGVAYKFCFEILKADPFVMMPSEIRRVIGHYSDVNLLPSKKIRAKRGDGLDSKNLTFNLIKDLFSLKSYTFENNNDQTDAIAVALAYNLVSGDEHTRSIFSTRFKTGSKRRGSKEGLSLASLSVSSGPKPRKQRSRRKV